MSLIYKRFVFILFTTVAIIFILLAVNDKISYQMDGMATCQSDNMYFFRKVIQDYRQSHEGRFPNSPTDAINSLGYNNYTLPKCTASHKPYVYMPNSARIGSGQIILMCPLSSHGFITKFSHGLAYENDRWKLVKIDKNGKIIKNYIMH